jgi:hypothetical protein
MKRVIRRHYAALLPGLQVDMSIETLMGGKRQVGKGGFRFEG